MQEHHFLARFISIGIYAILAFVLMMQIRRSNGGIKKYLRIYTICLTIMAWFFIPNTPMDLYRLWITANTYKHLSFADMTVTLINSGWSQPFGILYVSILNKINPHLVPAVTAFLAYSNITHIMGDYYEKHDISSKAAAAVIFLFLSRGLYAEVISGVRCMLAFSFVARSIYDEIYNKKNILFDIPFYLVAVLLHKASIVAVAIWFIAKVVLGETGARRIVYLVVVVVISAAFTYYAGGLLESAVESSSGYLDSIGGGYYFLTEYIWNGLYLILSLNISFRRKKISISDDGIKMRSTFVFYAVFCFVFIWSYALFHRFISFTTMITLPLLMEKVSEETLNSNSERDVEISNLMIISFLFLLAGGLRGNLNGLRFFDF